MDKEPKTAEQILTSDLNLIRLAEWLAIEHDKTKLQFEYYLESAQELLDYIHVLGFSETDCTKCKASTRQQVIEEIFSNVHGVGIINNNCDVQLTFSSDFIKRIKQWPIKLGGKNSRRVNDKTIIV